MKVQRYSEQRNQIYQAVCASKVHPTAQMIYDELRPRMPKLSLGTVYRNLQQMAKNGQVMEIDGPVTRFDAVVQPHPHLRCQCCGRVADVALPYDTELDRAVDMEGWNVVGHQLMFTGICPACAGENRR